MNQSTTTNAAIRHQARIAAAKHSVRSSELAMNAAARRGDFDAAAVWLEETKRHRQTLQTLRTLPIHTNAR